LLNYLALSYIYSHQDRDAVSSLKRCLDIDPHNIIALVNLGLLHLDRKDFKEAIACLQKATDLDGSDLSARIGLGNALAEDKQVAEAIRQFRLVVEKEQENIVGHYNLGVTLAEKGDFKEAIASYQTAARLASQQGLSNSSVIHTNLAASFVAENKKEEARKYCNLALETNPNDAIALNIVANLYM